MTFWCVVLSKDTATPDSYSVLSHCSHRMSVLQCHATRIVSVMPPMFLYNLDLQKLASASVNTYSNTTGTSLFLVTMSCYSVPDDALESVNTTANGRQV